MDETASRFAALRRSVARLPIVTFLVLTFAWAWILWGYWIPAMPPGGLVITPAFIVTAIAGGLAPSLAAVACSGMIGGALGVRELLAPLLRAGLHPAWYAFALLMVPLFSVAAAFLQQVFVGPLKPVDPALIGVAAVWPLMAALGEEIGWRGFMQPRLQERVGVLAAALVIGVVWGIWHLPADWIGLKAYGDWFFAAFLINGPVVLTAHAIILAWLWVRTRSLLIAVIYHFSVTGSAMLTPSAGEAGVTGIAASAIGAGLVWLVALGLIMFRRADFGRAGTT
jgi:membrane protease YdiL (CAAX protease family)